MAEHEARIKTHEEAMKAGKADAAADAIQKEQAAKHREHKEHHRALARQHATVMDVVKCMERLTQAAGH